MNRQQRRARDKQIKKSKEKTTDLEQKMGLFDLMPDDCFVCHKSFDKQDKQMVTTWNVVVREKERSVKIYCPTCWNNAVSLLKQYGYQSTMKDKINRTKRVIFDDTDTRHAQLKIRLEYDGLTQAEFFRSLITGYLNKDKSMMEFIRNYKESNKKLSKRNMKYQHRDDQTADDLLGQFGIGDDELENIFDVIAKSNPDL